LPLPAGVAESRGGFGLPIPVCLAAPPIAEVSVSVEVKVQGIVGRIEVQSCAPERREVLVLVHLDKGAGRDVYQVARQR
jgi:hypothetical protein